MFDASLPSWIINIASNLGVGALFFFLFDQERRARNEERLRWEETLKKNQERWDNERISLQGKLEGLAEKTADAFLDNTKAIESVKNVSEQSVEALKTLTEYIYNAIKRK